MIDGGHPFVKPSDERRDGISALSVEIASVDIKRLLNALSAASPKVCRHRVQFVIVNPMAGILDPG